MVELIVDKVAYDTQHQRAIVVLRDSASSRYLPIIVGPTEASAIAMAIEGIDAPRPQTHDLLKQILDRLDVTVTGILIDDVRDDTFFAQISMTRGESLYEVDSRPSDAIALALRAKVPIRALPRVLDLAGIPVEDEHVH